MEAEGVEFITGVEVGEDIPLSKLQKENEAVVLAGGATNARDLNVPGRDAEGIHFAVDFLKENTKRILGDKNPGYISAEDKDVIVIGGGDTGTDCVATSIRQGCNSVTQFEIMPEPPGERQTDNPWPEWPKTLKIDYGQEEAKELYGSDPRHFLIMTKEIIKDEFGQVKGVKAAKIHWDKDEEGNFIPVEEEGTEKVWPADLVLIAMGFLGPEETLIEDGSLEQDESSNIKAEYGDFKTNIEGVFVAGDMRRGQSLVVNAIDEGRKVAESINEYLLSNQSRIIKHF